MLILEQSDHCRLCEAPKVVRVENQNGIEQHPLGQIPVRQPGYFAQVICTGCGLVYIPESCQTLPFR